MNVQKLIAIAAAILINVLVLAWFHAWSTAVASAAQPARSDTIVTLPTINVHPSAEQLRELHGAPTVRTPRRVDAADGAACLAMPYYSFATPCTVAVDG